MLNFIEEAKLKSIINAGLVTDEYIDNYLQGVTYELWSEGKDLSETVTVVVGQDENGVDIIEEQLLNVYTPIDVSTQVAQWKLENYAMLREAEYPSWKEFADAYVKDYVVGMEAYKAKCLAVKVKYSK